MQKRHVLISGEIADDLLKELLEKSDTNFAQQVRIDHAVCENLREDLRKLGVPESVIEACFDRVADDKGARGYLAEIVKGQIEFVQKGKLAVVVVA